jgi:hypothetical protein
MHCSISDNINIENIRFTILDSRNYYQEVASSSAKRTPPTGARKAAVTPAAAPQVIRSLRSKSFLKYLIQFQVRPYLRDPPWPSKEAMQAPVCTIGPSLPSTKPADTPNMEPIICRSPKP